MQKIIPLLNKLEIWFFYGFLITFTLTIRKVLFFYPIRGNFNEYTGIYLYLSDIFLILVLITGGLSILYNKLILKSSIKFYFVAYLKQKIVIIPLLLVILSFASAFWSNNWQVSFFRSIKLLEFYLLYLWVIFRMFHVEHDGNEKCSTCLVGRQAWNIFRNSFRIVVFTGLVQSIIAIWQFIIQKSIGLTWFRESIISPDISGVAKIVLDGEKYIRAYGLFPHPNILGGFLVLSIILTFALLRPFNFFRNLKNVKNEDEMFHHSQDGTLLKECSTWNILWGRPGKNEGTNVEIKKKAICSTWNIWLYYIILGIQILALLLTFSKSAWIALIIALVYLWIINTKHKKQNLNMAKKDSHACPIATKCSTWNILFATGMEHIKYFALLAGIVFLIIVIIKPDWYSVLGKSFEDRMLYLNVSRGTFLENPILGVGMGQYVYQLVDIPGIQDWQFQPVHNVFLLILNELGILGLILFLFSVWEILKNVPPASSAGGRGIFKAVLFGFLFIMLVDHYFWDIQQGQIMFWLFLGLLAGCKVWGSFKSETYPQA